jgi:acyl-CoA thioester hydrolase
VEAHVRVAFVCDGRARPIPKALRTAMRADQDSSAADPPVAQSSPRQRP